MTNKKSEIRGILTELERDYLTNPNRDVDYKKDMNIRQKAINSFVDIIYILKKCSQKQKIKIVQQFQTYWKPELIDKMVNYEEAHGIEMPSWLRESSEAWNIWLGRNLIDEFLEVTLEISINGWEKLREKSLYSLEKRRGDYRRNRQMLERDFERWNEQGWNFEINNITPLTKEEFLKTRLESTYIKPLASILQKHGLLE